MKKNIFLIVMVFLKLSPAIASEIHVAVAANFRAPMEQIATEFTKAAGTKLILSYGSTGKFYAQIKNGAPYDIFLAADREYPQKLLQENLAKRGSEFTYAIGKLVLWSPKPTLVDDQGAVLRIAPFLHIAIATPKLAPYGMAAKQVLEKWGLWSKLEGKLVYGESVTQAFQFVDTGNAELGFVAFSQIKGINQGSYWMIPQELYSPLRQDAILLKKGQSNARAKEFMEFLKGASARRIILEFGYDQ